VPLARTRDSRWVSLQGIMFAMILVLQPGIGVPPLHFGMTVDEAMVAAAGWGELTLNATIGHRDTPVLYARFPHAARDIHINFEDGTHVTSVTIWQPTRAGDLTVSFDGIDIFTTPVGDVLSQLQERGFVLVDDDPGFPRFDEIALGFNADFIIEDNDDEDEDDFIDPAKHRFASVQLSPPGYYGRSGWGTSGQFPNAA
jgi:hypothetical protein